MASRFSKGGKETRSFDSIGIVSPFEPDPKRGTKGDEREIVPRSLREGRGEGWSARPGMDRSLPQGEGGWDASRFNQHLSTEVMARSARWLSIGSRDRRKKASRWRGSKLRSNLSSQGMLVPLILDATFQGIGWIASTLFRTEKLYDLFGAGTFLALAVQGCTSSSTGDARKNVLLTGMTCTWALRLGTFLVTRVFRRGGDRRFDRAKENPSLFFVFWFMQGVWVFVTLLPLFLVQNRGLESAWSSSDTIGLVIWTSGFLVESVADYQKFVFRSVPTNKDKFIRSGLWKYSRHPNYFGEIMLWWGFWLCSISSIPGIQLKTLAASSPVLVTLLLTKVSGIPLLEEAADAKWGQEKDYQEYKQRTPLLLPLPRF